MTEIYATNVNDALPQGLRHLIEYGVPEPSRYGDVIVSPDPVMTIYERPEECVLFNPTRNANPWFHLLGDSIWCIAGRNDISWPVYFNQRFTEFSDDGIIAPGAYGFRWREYFGYDQFELIVKELRENPNSRRAVLQMWHGEDLARVVTPPGTKDACCNLCVMFDCRGGELNMTVVCRSNDGWWGAYGANAVQFSILQQLLAAWLEVPVGVYRQFSNNFHLYTHIVSAETAKAVIAEPEQPYPGTIPLVQYDAKVFLAELDAWMVNPLHSGGFKEPFFPGVAVPMFAAWTQRKEKQGDGLRLAQQIAAPDWRKACVEWIERAEARRAAKEDIA